MLRDTPPITMGSSGPAGVPVAAFLKPAACFQAWAPDLASTMTAGAPSAIISRLKSSMLDCNSRKAADAVIASVGTAGDQDASGGSDVGPDRVGDGPVAVVAGEGTSGGG
ncbi:hypothetical protein ARZXY2_1931 [Arthrobacter sp. ZXY-2]|nr:hypothetical protein ARZXY2_1931 [Arthrobacter sp. ZXY-2]